MGNIKILYVAPERLDSEGFAAFAEKVPISFVAVDESHCISQWGQDFRPSYLRIVQFIEALPQRPVVGAYTATATKQVQQDIRRLLKLQNPLSRVTGFDRPNLYFEVRHPESKDGELLRLLATRKRKSGIIYCATRKNVETVCDFLKDRGYNATRYHAGLDEKERSANQEDFLYDRKTVMVATNAFGMGIDKSNVSFVIHYNMPRSIESYYQEAGRAGRDGSDAECVLLYSPRDVSTAQFMINNGSDNEELTDIQREIVRQQDKARLDAMVRYCKCESCLRGCILEYFGQKHPEVCGNCGSCNEGFEKEDITREAQMILSCVKRIYDRVGYYADITILARTLRGSRDQRILELGLDELTTYGLLRQKTRTEVHELIDHLEAEGYLISGDREGLCLTNDAKEVLYRGRQVSRLVKKEPEVEISTQKQEVKLTGEEADLLEILKEVRSRLAKEAGVPPFVVFSNATLGDMAKKKPINTTAFKKVSGVGELKASWYGKAFVERIRQFIKEQG